MHPPFPLGTFHTQVFAGSTVLAAVADGTRAAFLGKLMSAVWGNLSGGCRLLFRSSRDGASAADFHRLCDGKGATVTLILDKDGNVFGGYTVQQWDDADAEGMFVGDVNACVFTIVNPRGGGPVFFRATFKHEAVLRSPKWGPCFGVSTIRISAAFDAGCSTSLDGVSFSDTDSPCPHYPDRMFTGSPSFTPYDVEVWEV